MISAREAKVISDRCVYGAVNIEADRIDQAIRQAANLGHTEIRIYDSLRQEVRKMIIDNGFRLGFAVEEYGTTCYIIGWEYATDDDDAHHEYAIMGAYAND